MKPLLITIDGPAGAGKTSISRLLADRLGYRYLDTGALYRVIAYQAAKTGVQPDNDTELESLCREIRLEIVPHEKSMRLLLDGKDITNGIRTPEISMLASAVSAKPVVRNFLLEIQRRIGADKAIVCEGRDMGTVVFPNADVKFYLDADPEVRALRRYREMPKDSAPSLGAVEADIRKRDHNDKGRSIAPLTTARDAVIIDSTHLSIDEVVEKMLYHIENKDF